ncbi:thioesterase family protein [Gemmobacter nectariphilus]|uniref:thioesterase family protein n=1 Tax=Gemmobacter nectariphilus TaxID=220343 RepID=UPI003CCBBD23
MGDEVCTDMPAEAALAACSGLLAACATIPEPDRAAALAGLLRSLKDRDLGLGRLLARLDRRRAGALSTETGDLVQLQVLPAWIDYNGHMTESRYLFACSEVTDAFLRRIGAGLDYVATGFSYYSAETHIRHLGESKLGERLMGRVQVLAADPKRLHLFTTLCRGADVVATLEQMLLHVDMRANRACPAHPAVLARLMPIAAAHAALPVPEGAGRHVGQRRDAPAS